MGGGDEARRGAHDDALEGLRDALTDITREEVLSDPLKRAKAAGVSPKILKAARGVQDSIEEATRAFAKAS